MNHTHYIEIEITTDSNELEFVEFTAEIDYRMTKAFAGNYYEPAEPSEAEINEIHVYDEKGEKVSLCLMPDLIDLIIEEIECDQ